MSRGEGLNLARHPFANSRPVVRTALLLWVLGGLLLAANVFLFWGYFAGSGEQRARLDRIESDIERVQRQSGEMENQVAGLDLARQNERVLFLNDKIAERTFSWSLLFDRVAEVLPAEVRLRRLTPASGDEEQGAGGAVRRRRSESRAVGGAERIDLTLGGEAMNDEALSRLIDNLFNHPSFRDPNQSSESKDRQTGLITFDLRVTYLPGALAAPAGEAGEATIEELPVPTEGPAEGTAAPDGSAAPSAAGAGR